MTEQERKFIEDLYQAYYEKVYKVVYIRLQEKEKAKDVTQEVFYIAAVHAEKLMQHPNKIGWLFETANKCTKREIYNKKSKRNEEGKLEVIKEVPLFDLPEVVLQYQESFFEESLTKEIEGILTEKEKKFVKLRYEDDLKYEDIAKKLKINVSASTSLGSRVKKKIKNFLELRDKNKK